MADSPYETLALLSAEFRGFVKGTLAAERDGRISPERAVEMIREEFEQYDAMVKTTRTFHLSGGESQ